MDAGYDAFLVGEHLVKSGDRRAPGARGTCDLMFVKICGITNREDALAAVERARARSASSFIHPARATSPPRSSNPGS